MQWLKKRMLRKYPSTLYISLNKGNYSEINFTSELNKQKLISINSSSSQNDINSISSSPETYQV